MRLTFAIPAIALALQFHAAATVQSGTFFDPGRYRSADPAAEANFQRGSAYFVQKQYGAARGYLAAAAQRNHPRAEELMGQIYMFGYGVPVDTTQAFRYFNAAALQGHRGALADMGFFYSQVEIDLARADQYFVAAARCGNLDAQVELGLNYEFGRGVQRNRQQAVYWLMQAAPHWGKAGYIAEWLQAAGTPRFQNVDQLSNYISAKINQRFLMSLPNGGDPNRPRIYSLPSCGMAGLTSGASCYSQGTITRKP
jgi:TPR repeat protein